jgi:curved DNA-binding protein CbpA
MIRHRVTHYDTLGVDRDASEEDIRAAFRRLTREHHPDRFTGDERAQAETHFQTITEAFNVLARPEAREKYDHELSVFGGSGDAVKHDPKELAKRLAARGAELLKTGNTHEATDHLKLAIDHDDTNSRAHYYYGFALSRLKGKEREGLRHLERAVALEPSNATYKAEAAVTALAVGIASRAERLANEALALDPSNKKAIAVLESSQAPAENNAGGLLGRLKRKG